MRGVVIHAPGDLRVEELPDQPLGAHDVRIGIEAGGICGSDLHYFNHGGTGTIRLREPMVLGHEVAGTIAAVGGAVSTVAAGTRVVVNPSRACGRCRYCQQGLQNHCTDMRFIGSAMRFPHVQGGFRQTLVMDEAQAVPIAAHVTAGEAAMAEPLAVCLHAVGRAGPLPGRRVLVTGCGPIGGLAVLAARQAGAGEIVAADVQDFPLETARSAGADVIVNTARDADALAELARDGGPFDVLIEASGNAGALRGGLVHLHPRGVVVQLGLGGDVPLPINAVVTREIEVRGSFRFHAEFGQAVDLMNRGRIDVKPFVTATLPFRQANEAFALANDRSRAMKVQLDFT